MRIKFHDIAQNTDEWLAMRAGKLTGSGLSKIMANYGKAFGNPAKQYVKNTALERITGKPVRSKYKNEAMEKGHENEPIAIMEYSDLTFSEVTNGGFFCNEFVGCSPDGLVGDHGLIEVKFADQSAIHFDRIKRQSFDSAYKWQVIGNLMLTGRKWIDFISYCPEYPKGKQIYIKRVFAKDVQDEFEMIRKRIEMFLPQVEEAKQIILNASYINQLAT